MGSKWAGSTRSSRLPKDWAKRRAVVRDRASSQCQWPTCMSLGAECDHITPGDDHSLANLQWLCKRHHQAKTLNEAQRARGYIGKLRPAEKHPGIK